MGYYYHAVPGRLRVKTPALKNSPRQAEKLSLSIEGINGVRSVLPNTVTGSMLVTYDPAKTSSASIIRHLSAMGYFEEASARTNDDVIRGAASSVGMLLGRAVMGAGFDLVLAGTPLSALAFII